MKKETKEIKIYCTFCDEEFTVTELYKFPLCSEECAIRFNSIGGEDENSCWIEKINLEEWNEDTVTFKDGEERNIHAIAFELAVKRLSNEEEVEKENLGYNDIACYRLNNKCRNHHHYKRVHSWEGRIYYIPQGYLPKILERSIEIAEERLALALANFAHCSNITADSKPYEEASSEFFIARRSLDILLRTKKRISRGYDQDICDNEYPL